MVLERPFQSVKTSLKSLISFGNMQEFSNNI